MFGLLSTQGIGHASLSDYPTSPEEYAVYALALQQDIVMREIFVQRQKLTSREYKHDDHGTSSSGDEVSHGDQLLSFIDTLMKSTL